jgi:hypothetical protein
MQFWKGKFLESLVVIILLGVFALTTSFVVRASQVGNLPVDYDGERIRITLDGREVRFPDQQPVLINSEVFAPVRGVMEHLGFYVEWFQASTTARITKDQTEIWVGIGRDFFFVDGERIELDTPARTMGGRTMLPLRVILEAAGYRVTQTEDGSTVWFEIESVGNGDVDECDTECLIENNMWNTIITTRESPRVLQSITTVCGPVPSDRIRIHVASAQLHYDFLYNTRTITLNEMEFEEFLSPTPHNFDTGIGLYWAEWVLVYGRGIYTPTQFFDSYVGGEFIISPVTSGCTAAVQVLRKTLNHNTDIPEFVIGGGVDCG